jgi:hypothetical protein
MNFLDICNYIQERLHFIKYDYVSNLEISPSVLYFDILYDRLSTITVFSIIITETQCTESEACNCVPYIQEHP